MIEFCSFDKEKSYTPEIRILNLMDTDEIVGFDWFENH